MVQRFERCPLCSRSVGAPVAVRRGFSFHRCVCGLALANEVAGAAATVVVSTDPDYYAQTSRRLARTQRAAESIVVRRAAEYEKRLSTPVRRLLEIGPGAGPFAQAWLDRGVKWLGIEIDPVMAKGLRDRGWPVLEAEFTAVTDEQFGQAGGEARFDVISASAVFEHVAQPHVFVARAFELLRPGGLLHLDLPNDEALTAVFRRAFSRTDFGFLQPPHHLLAWRDETLVRVLAEGGFKQVESFIRPNHDPLWGTPLGATDSLFHRSVYTVADWLRRGSVLVGLAQK